MSIIKLEDTTSFNTYINENSDVVIDFYADWCGPCKLGAPLFESRSTTPKYNHIKFAMINIDNIRDELDKYDISSIPVLMRYKNGKLYKRLNGLNTNTLNDILL